MEIPDLWSDEAVERTASAGDTAFAARQLAADICLWRGYGSVLEWSVALFVTPEATHHGLQHNFCSLWKTHFCALRRADGLD